MGQNERKGVPAEGVVNGSSMPETTPEEALEKIEALFETGDEYTLDTDQLMYYAEKLQVDDPALDDFTPEKMWANIRAERPELFEEEPEGEEPEKEAPARKPRLLRRLAYAALVAVLACALTATVMGRNPLQIISELGSEFFTVSGNVSGNMVVSDAIECEYHSFREALDSVSDEYIPAITWIPEDYSIEKVEVLDMLGTYDCMANYISGRGMLFVDAAVLKENTDKNEMALGGEKSQGGEIYHYNNCDYFFGENYDMVVVSWQDDYGVYYISGNVTIDEMKQIIESIK